MRIDRIDHLMLTVADIDATVEFYARVLGMKAVTEELTAHRVPIEEGPVERTGATVLTTRITCRG